MRTETRTVRIGEWVDGVSPEGWKYCSSGFSIFSVVHIGMYDGWPFWKPTPAIGWIGPLGTVEVAFWYNLRAHNLTKQNQKQKQKRKQNDTL